MRIGTKITTANVNQIDYKRPSIFFVMNGPVLRRVRVYEEGAFSFLDPLSGPWLGGNVMQFQIACYSLKAPLPTPEAQFKEMSQDPLGTCIKFGGYLA